RGRQAHRHLWQQRRVAQQSRWDLSASTQAALLRADDQAGMRQARHHLHPRTAFHSDPPAQRPNGIHYCGQCGRGCQTNSNFSSPGVLIKPALDTGKLTLITGAMAREVTIDRNGVATGVTYIQTKDGTEQHVRARVVVLAASAFESARLMLNSKSALFPHGLANSSGIIGKYITDTTGAGLNGFIPKMVNRMPHNEDGSGGNHIYMPWTKDNKKLDFPRGYHIEVGGGFDAPSYGFMGGIQRYPNAGGYGKSLKDDYRRYFGASVGFAGRGEMIPNDDCYCEVDPKVVDKYGIPVLRFHWKWSDHEINQ